MLLLVDEQGEDVEVEGGRRQTAGAEGKAGGRSGERKHKIQNSN
jgi:hypothetical protein